jgi:hypothetical protein
LVQGDQQRQPELSTAEADKAAKQPDRGAGSEPSGGIAGQTVEVPKRRRHGRGRLLGADHSVTVAARGGRQTAPIEVRRILPVVATQASCDGATVVEAGVYGVC